MNWKPYTSLFACGLLAQGLFAQLQRIVLQGSGAPQVFTSIQAAIAAAQPDDRLYLSGGTFNDTNIEISMPLHFFGAGIGPDTSAVTSTTTISTPDNSGGSITITTEASGSTFTGIRFNPDHVVQYGLDANSDDPTDLVFERCVFDKPLDLVNGSAIGASSTVFNECIFHRTLYGESGVTATLTRCILDYVPGTGATVSNFDGGGLTMRHCIALGANIGNSTNSTIENSIFTSTSAPFWQSNGSTLTNNLLVSTVLVSNMSAGPAVGNELGVPIDSIFLVEGNDDFDWSDNLHVQAGCVGAGMATDGTDVGVYGSSSPWKEGSAPFNPHFRTATIAPATNASGELPVNIRVAAQTH